MRFLLVFIVCLAQTLCSDVISTVRRATRELNMRFANQAYMEEIPKSITACISNPAEHSKSFCQEAAYLDEIGEHLSRYSFSAVSSTGKKRRVPKSPEIVDISADPKAGTSFQYMFENFVLRNKPFRGVMDSALTSAEGDNHLAKCVALAGCSRNLVVTPFMNDSSINQFSPHLVTESKLSLVVPKIAANNYLYRVLGRELQQDVEAAAKTADDGGTLPFAPLVSQWPTTFQLKRGEAPGGVHQCPGTMHMVLWTTSVQSKIKVRLFPQALADRFGLDLGSFPLHSPGFKSDGFPTTDAEQANLPSFSEALLDSFQYLFIPSNLIVGITLDSETSGSSGTEKVQLFRSCFVDASNFNSFRKYLDLVGRVSSYEAELGKILQDSRFVTSMSRDAADTNHFALLDQKSSSLEPQSASPDEAPLAEDPQVAKKGRNRADRRNRGASGGGSAGGAFKEWQENNKWNKMVTSLTIPPPGLPRLVNVGRKNITLEWISPFMPTEGDKTAFGFNITICSESIVDGNSAGDGGNCRNVTLERIERQSEMRLRERKAKTGHSTFSADVTDLEPSSPYRYRINIFFENFQSLPSVWSPILVTGSLTAPSAVPLPVENFAVGFKSNVNVSPLSCTSFEVSAPKPFDHGGSPILGFRVYTRFVDDAYHSDWLLNGQYAPKDETAPNVTLLVKNVIPGPLYEIAIAPYNSIGEAALSATSDPVSCSCDRKKQSAEILHGYEFQTLYASESKATEEQTQRVVLVDGSNQLVACRVLRQDSDLFVIDSWAGHYSLHVKVMGSPVWTNASNSPSLVGKIAVVMRNGEPLLTKARRAQKAGAIAMIVVDTEDRCKQFDQECVPGATKRLNEGWGRVDIASMWKNIHMPMLLVPNNASQQLEGCIVRAQHPDTVTPSHASEEL